MAGKTTLKEWSTPEKLKQVTEWGKLGLTNIQIAHNIGIVEQTLYKWRKLSPEFADALEKGKAVMDTIVVNTMIKKIVGYEYDEVTKERDEATGELVETKRVTKYQHPDTTSMIFWLKNRIPEEFRDSQLTKAQREKVEVETKILNETLAKLRGDVKDTSLLESLTELFKK